MNHTMLACRSEFSMGEAILSPEKLVEIAKDRGQSVVALTDTMSVTAMIAFTQAATKAGIKPIIGARLRLTDDPLWRQDKGQKRGDMPRSYMLAAYARTEEGMKALYRLLSRGAAEDRFYYEAKLGFDDLYDVLGPLGPGHLDLVMGDENSLLEHPEVERIASELVARNGQLRVPLVPVDTPYHGRLTQIAADLCAKSLATPIVLRPVLYPAGHADARDIMAGIVTGTRLADPWFLSRYSRDLHALTNVELTQEAIKMARQLSRRGIGLTDAVKLFHQGLAAQQDLVDGIAYTWTKQKPSLPEIVPDQFGTLVKECMDGWKLRFASPVFAHKPTQQELADVYMPRLKYELETLKKLDFAGYFLLVQDIVRFAKSSGILVGPGRGSVGGSLVAYLMGITDCDPIRFNLLFERFINPERLDLPDADLDFMSERRHEVIEYLVRKYGEKRVAGVSNFGTLGAPSAIRDVGRCAGLPESVFNVSRFVPKVHSQPLSLEDSVAKAPEIAAFQKDFPELWPIMGALEGVLRNLSQHAAGVVVAGVDLEERAVVERRSDQSVVCWDKQIVELQGLIKVDVLGLRTLDLIGLTLQYIRERHSKIIDLMRIPLDDPKVLDAFAHARTTGIFQYEGGGARRILKDIARGGALTFDDVAAVSALNRPGPLEAGLVEIFRDNRSGMTPITYVSPHTEDALHDTYGAIVYQEQVMQISKDLSGFSGAEADVLRKAIGKKDAALMAKQREKFVLGAIAGYIEVTLEDGSVHKVHRSRRFKVLESDEKFTMEEILEKDLTLQEKL